MAKKYFGALQNVIAGGEQPKSRRLHDLHAVHNDDWKAECELLGLLDRARAKNSQRAKFSNNRAELVAANMVACQGDHTWIKSAPTDAAMVAPPPSQPPRNPPFLEDATKRNRVQPPCFQAATEAQPSNEHYSATAQPAAYRQPLRLRVPDRGEVGRSSF